MLNVFELILSLDCHWKRT